MQAQAQVNLLWETVGIYTNKYLFVSHLQSRIAHFINKSKLNIYQPIIPFVAIEKTLQCKHEKWYLQLLNFIL